jgi:hypothetical protein
MSRRHLAEPTLVLLALGAAAVLVLCIIAILDTDDVWLVVVTALAIALIGLAIIVEARGVIGESESAPDAESASGRAIVVSTTAMTAPEVLDALGREDGETSSIMVVCPEGLGSGGLLVDERDYDRAHRAEAATVAALRRAGINAAGQVGDRNPAHAIEDALALFPAARIVVVARGTERDIYRKHVNADELRRRTGARLDLREVAEA